MADREPYVGPHALAERDGIYGRDWERAELRDLLLARGIVLMHSPSGAGKTSLVQAGLIPLLKPRDIDVLGPVRPGLPVTVESVPRSHTRYSLSMLAQLDDSLPKERRLASVDLSALNIQSYLEHRRETGGERRRQLLILDQFEEVLTLDPTDLEAKRLFFQHLGDALRAVPGLVLFCIREDYVGSLEPYLRYLPTRLATRFRLDLLTEGPALEAIKKPALSAGVRFSDGAARHIWRSLSETLVPQADGTVRRVPGPYVEAVQLQVVCKQLWNAPRRQHDRITRQDVELLGRIDDALGRFYSEAVEGASKVSGAPESKIRHWFGDRLISQGLRAQVMAHTEAMDNMPDPAVRELVNAHVLREEWRRNVRWLEVAHDRLLEPIVRSNSVWFEEHRTPLSRQAARWHQSGQTADSLLSLEALSKARPESRLEEEFVRASRAARYAERRTNLAITGWGVIFAYDADPQIIEALELMLAQRRDEAGERFKIYSGESGYREGETAEVFVSRQGGTPGGSDYAVIPYYLLLIGNPQAIPFEFQYALAMQHAVGRLDFDSIESFSVYSRTVVYCESGSFALPRRLFVFAPTHPHDTATKMSATLVAYPMMERFRQSHPDWTIQAGIGDDATKARLADAFRGSDAAAALCAIGHGVTFSQGDALQQSDTGALVCQDWPGLSGRVSPEHYFVAADVPDDARVIGMVACLVAGSSAGQPTHDDFGAQDTPKQVADRPFVSALAKRLLSHPNGAAIGVIGHVDRNWGFSLWSDRGKGSTGLFESVMSSLMNGHTIGSAMTPLAQRTSFLYAALGEFYRTKTDSASKRILHLRLVATLDARNYILVGDPAARLPLTSTNIVSDRPLLPAAVSGPIPSPRPRADGPEEVVFGEVDGRFGDGSIAALTAREILTILRGGSLELLRLESLRERYSRQ